MLKAGADPAATRSPPPHSALRASTELPSGRLEAVEQVRIDGRSRLVLAARRFRSLFRGLRQAQGAVELAIDVDLRIVAEVLTDEKNDDAVSVGETDQRAVAPVERDRANALDDRAGQSVARGTTAVGGKPEHRCFE